MDVFIVVVMTVVVVVAGAVVVVVSENRTIIINIRQFNGEVLNIYSVTLLFIMCHNGKMKLASFYTYT